MEADSPPSHPDGDCHVKEEAAKDRSLDEIKDATGLNNSCDAHGSDDSSLNAFNSTVASNVTVIENNKRTNPCEGSDSGVETDHLNNCQQSYQRALSSNSGVQSCDSSIISCCSNYDDAYNLLVRRNSTLIIDDYDEGVRRAGDGTSENGSESSSVTGSSSSRNSKRNANKDNNNKKKVSVVDARKVIGRSNKPPAVNAIRVQVTARPKSDTNSISRPSSVTKKNQAPSTLAVTGKVKEKKSNSGSNTRASSVTRTPAVTPTDDGRWPSVNSKPAPLMSKSLRGIMMDNPPKKMSTQQIDKTIEKYATLPRRRKDKVMVDDLTVGSRKSREDSISRLAMPKKPISGSTPAKVFSHLYASTRGARRQKVKIYHEANVQTALTMTDVEKALSGLCVSPMSPCDVEKCDRSEQVDLSLKDFENLQSKLAKLEDQYDRLNVKHKLQGDRLLETESKLREEIVEKQGLEEELRVSSQRVLAILGETANTDDKSPSDSLMVLESRFQNVSQIVIHQEEEISKLNSFCRLLQIDLEKSLNTQKILMQQLQDLENESCELQDFMQAEKSTLADALKEAENEVTKTCLVLKQRDGDLQERQEELKRISKLNEQRWQENLSLQARLGAMEAKSRELLVHQGGSVSGTAVALSALKDRLKGLVDELVESYEISDQDVEDVIFHNEAYSNSSSSPDATPEISRKLFADKCPSPKSGSSFMSAVFNAIRNAAAQTPFSGHHHSNKENGCNDDANGAEPASPGELLDSETEPCLMMEHVLEDVVVPDGHSHNMISSTHMSHSESLKDLSQIVRSRQLSEYGIEYGSYCSSLSASFCNDANVPSLSDILPSFSLVDQVIDVDNLVTRLLKVIQILQIASDERMGELEDVRDELCEQISKQQANNKLVGKQLRDWEMLGARLKTEVKELLQQVGRKNNEIDNVKSELNNQRRQVDKLNQDVCELSTALAKAELEMKMREEEVSETIKSWESAGGEPTPDILGQLVMAHNEVPILKEKLSEKERQLTELTQEFLTTRHVLTESLKEAVNEAKKQYEAIDNALEVLHNNQNVVKQCSPLADLQRELENTSFQSASAMPLAPPADYNANAALMKAIANMPTINTTA